MLRDDLFDLRGRVAVVAGGAGLLGPRHGEALAAFGARVVLLDRDAAACQKGLELAGPDARAIQADLSRPEDVRRAFDQVLAEHGRIDVLVNNAAAKSDGFFEPFERFSLQDWNQVMASNVTTAFLCAQAAGAWMAEHGGGSIVNVASIYGVVAPDQRIYEGSEHMGRAINTPAIYSVTKGAVLALTRYLSTWWGEKGVRVNAITPGGVESGQNETFRRSYASRVPLGRMAAATDLQGAVVFLASPASSYVTGQNLIVDGGWTVW